MIKPLSPELLHSAKHWGTKMHFIQQIIDALIFILSWLFQFSVILTVAWIMFAVLRKPFKVVLSVLGDLGIFAFAVTLSSWLWVGMTALLAQVH